MVYIHVVIQTLFALRSGTKPNWGSRQIKMTAFVNEVWWIILQYCQKELFEGWLNGDKYKYGIYMPAWGCLKDGSESQSQTSIFHNDMSKTNLLSFLKTC